ALPGLRGGSGCGTSPSCRLRPPTPGGCCPTRRGSSPPRAPREPCPRLRCLLPSLTFTLSGPAARRQRLTPSGGAYSRLEARDCQPTLGAAAATSGDAWSANCLKLSLKSFASCCALAS